MRCEQQSKDIKRGSAPLAMRKITRSIERHSWLIALVLVWSAVLAAFAFARHERLNSSTYDLAIKAQVIWNTYQGDWFASSIEVEHYLGDHEIGRAHV